MSEEGEVLQGLINQASEAFDDFCDKRHKMGEDKYGPVKFLEVNSIEEAMFEIVDLGNYARYTFIKLYLLNLWIHQKAAEHGMEDMVGDQTFIPNTDTFRSNHG